MRAWERSDVAPIIEKAFVDELSLHEIEQLLKSDELWALGSAALELKQKMYGKVCTYIKNMILNYTNECVVECEFCAFYRKPGLGYLYSPQRAAKIVEEIYKRYGIRQVLIQGGVNPKVDIEYFETLFKEIKKRAPKVSLHALSPVEIDFLSLKHKMSVKEVLSRLKEAGMESMPGGGAELLVERVRKILSPKKISVKRWIEIVETAHKLEIPTSVTMMFGHIENVEERAKHLYELRELQKRAPGSLAFIAWNFEPGNTRLARKFKIKYPYGGYELLRIISVARLTFKDLIPHVQAGWLTVGKDVAQLALNFGADDWGGTLYNEKVIPATGLSVSFPKAEDVERWIRGAGCIPKERDNFYRVVG
ncbi:MAG: CofH family radical SAM protein [Crenarchaeota archaeon]|nr:CofH family radical SAM protein [Thermoproteota archaeon]